VEKKYSAGFLTWWALFLARSCLQNGSLSARKKKKYFCLLKHLLGDFW
jgi:hypothetical protein